VTVDEAVGVIADDRQVESLAGIMGGDSTAVSDDTRNVYVEAAFWWPQAIQGRSRRFNFSTDAGHRFERGVDPSQTVEHIERITRWSWTSAAVKPVPWTTRPPTCPSASQ
jgi:phenylalanyl-tRNA synthetase beta chain